MIVHVDVLGGLRVHRGRKIVTRFRTRQAAGLLAYLVCHRQRPVSRETLLEILWPDGDPALTRQRLSQALSTVRNVVEPEPRARHTRILAGRDTIALAEAVSTDLDAFRDALDRTRSAPSRLEQDRALDAAIALHRGPLLPDALDDWVFPLRRSLEAQVLGAIAARRDSAVEAGDLGRALELARRATEVDPLDEPAHAAWFRLLRDAGRLSEGAREYRLFADRLRDELGVEPDPETTMLVEHGSRPAPRPTSRTPDDVFADGATFCLVGVRVHSARHDRVLSTIVDALGPRVVVDQSREGCPMLGFVRAPEAVAAISELRARTRSPGSSHAPSVVLCVADARVERGRFVSVRSAELADVLDATAPGWTVAMAGVIDLLGDPATLGVVELGRYDLGHARPLELVALTALSVDGGGDPVSAPRSFRTTIPRPANRFFGREAEIAEVRDRIGEGTRLTTLHGFGGAGKSRLATEIAFRLADDPFEGAWLVELESVRDPARIIAVVASALGATVRRGQDPLAAVAGFLGDRPGLLILDNLEQLMPDAAQVVVSLRDGLPTTTLLVTSRTPLGVRGERRIRLDPLPLPEQTDDVDVVAANPAVRLFVDRAEAIEPGFSLTARNAASTAELVRHLEGLPLAIELAAARVSVLTPAGIHRRFRIRTELADPSADRPERHRTLAGTIDWSHRLLDRRAQRGLAALSVLRGSFDLAAAEAVSGDPVAGDVLAELVDASLVVSEAGDEPRFRLLEAVREFADARLTRADRRRITERHLEHFRNVAVTWCPLLLGADAAAAVAVLDGESENLDAAIDTLIERGETRRSRSARGEARAAAIELIDVLSEYWSTRGRARMALDTLTGILADVGGVPDRSVARAMFQAGSFAVLLSLSDEAEAFLSGAIARFEAIGDRDYLARSHKSLGVLAFDRRRFDDAERHHRASLELHRALGDRRAIAQAIQNLGNVLSARGDIEAAREHFEESLAIKREVGSRRDLASALMGLGNVADRQGDLAAAGAFHEECLSIARAIRDERAIAMSLANLGSVRARGGDLSAGIELLVESAELHHRSGSDRFAANSLLMIGLLPGVDAYAEWLTPLVAASVSLLASMDVPLPDETRTEVSDLRKRLERQLGTGAVAALYEQGERMTAAEAVRHAGSIRS